MASIRRTLSAANNNDRSFRNHTLPHRNSSRQHSHSSPPSYPLFSRGKLQQHHNSRTRRCLFRLLLFFFLGFLFGLYQPFSELDDAGLSTHRFSSFPSSILPIATATNNNNNLPRRDLEAVRSSERKLLIVVTPTYNRAFQSYHLTRLGQTLRLVPPPLLWIVVEMDAASTETAVILRDTGIMYRHLVCDKNLTNVKDRGVHQRNAALEHIERHRLDGIVYFADDDNIYSLELFDHLREIRY